MDHQLQKLTGAEIPEPTPPTINISEAATNAFETTTANADGDSTRLAIDAHFQYRLYFGAREPGDIEVRTNAVTLLLDGSSAGRANGVSIDFIAGPSGGFTIDNPNEPPKEKEPKVKQRKDEDQIELKRDCEATLVPGGEKLKLLHGDFVVLTQALGGFTVMTDAGYLARIATQDADALGLGAPPATEEPAEAGPFELKGVIDKLKTVFDPEIPINVVDLGLIYVCEAQPLPDGGHKVEIKMSMTAPGCGMGDVLKEDARAKVQTVPGVAQVDVEIVWDPPWDQGRMSEAARLQLGMW